MNKSQCTDNWDIMDCMRRLKPSELNDLLNVFEEGFTLSFHLEVKED